MLRITATLLHVMSASLGCHSAPNFQTTKTSKHLQVTLFTIFKLHTSRYNYVKITIYHYRKKRYTYFARTPYCYSKVYAKTIGIRDIFCCDIVRRVRIARTLKSSNSPHVDIVDDRELQHMKRGLPLVMRRIYWCRTFFSVPSVCKGCVEIIRLPALS
jgi:hypothetical protein